MIKGFFAFVILLLLGSGMAVSLIPSLSHLPAPQFIYFAIFVTFLNFCWNVFQYFTEQGRKKAEELKSLKQLLFSDQFIFPLCIEPLRIFIKEHSALINIMAEATYPTFGIKKAKYNEYLVKFKNDKAQLLSSLLLIQPLASEVYDKTADALDLLEDDITAHCFLHGHEDPHGVVEIYKDHVLIADRIYSVLRDIMRSFIINYDKIIE